MGDADAHVAVETAPDEVSNAAGNFSSPFLTQGSSLWVDTLPKTEHVAFFRKACDQAPALGPFSGWSLALRFYTTMLFADSRAACLYWGPDRVAVYNEKFAPLVGGAHPVLMGKSLEEGFPSVWNDTREIFNQAVSTGQTMDVDNILLFPVRYGFMEETYFVGQFIPLTGDNGGIEGIYNTIYESTTQVLHERRRRVVQGIASVPPCTVDENFTRVLDMLRTNPYDIPMAMLYSLDEFANSGSSRVRLRGTIGIQEGGLKGAPSTADLSTDSSKMVSLFRQATERGGIIVLSTADGSLQSTGDLFEGVQWRGFGEPSRDIVLLPLSSGGRALGFYIQGTNPRRSYDQSTEMSIIDLARQIEAKWVASMSIEEAKRREQLLEQRLTDSERKLRHMAQSAPLGMCSITPEHNIEWANDQFYEITGHLRSKPAMTDFWKDVIDPADKERSSRELASLFESESRTTSELRLRRKWQPPVDEAEAADHTAWILTVGISVFENGKPKFAMGYVTDISPQKWAESVQSRNAAAATLAKSRQEEFIDMTSHEMRNPLTAITQLADSISQSLNGIEGPEATQGDYKTVAQQNVESAQTILTCAAHQKRVIDDVLMLSRLESQMISITPVIDRPMNVVTNTVKMFDGEVSMHDTSIEIVRDVSYDNLDLGYVLCDTSRLAQILINLISNAIKFTCTRPTRRISVVYGAKSRRPPRIRTIFGDLKWMDLLTETCVNTALPDLRDDEAPLYLYFCIQDTGPGVTPEEMDRLFKRFSQANSRTHIAYGGTGLGLYICRELAEKQGGGVGVVSEPGEGSVFGFFIETRLAEAPNGSQNARPGSRATKVSSARPELPQRLASKDEVPKVVNTPKAASTTAAPTILPEHPKPFGGFRVLLVEDNLLNQKILAKQLEAKKCHVTVANNGVEALEVLESAGCWETQAHNNDQTALNGFVPIDIVLMDWEMPVMDGLTCSKRIREREHEGQLTRRLPIIAITANVREAQKDMAIAAGMDNVMSKPFTVNDLLTRMHDTVRQAKKDLFQSVPNGTSEH